MAIFGTLLFAGEVLDVSFAAWHVALKSFCDLSAEAGRLQSWDHKVIISADALTELAAWTAICLENKPVHVVAPSTIVCRRKCMGLGCGGDKRTASPAYQPGME